MPSNNNGPFLDANGQ
jgi:hypothetical protein